MKICWVIILWLSAAFSNLWAVVVEIDGATFEPLRVGLVMPSEDELELRRILDFTRVFQTIGNQGTKGFQEANMRNGDVVSFKGSKNASFKVLLTLGIVETKKDVQLKADVYDLLLKKKIQTYALEGSQKTAVFKDLADKLLELFTKKPGIYQSKLVFVGKETKKASPHIYLASPDGLDVEKITTQDSDFMSPTISPDGRYIVYTAFYSKHPNLYLYDRQTKKTVALTDGEENDSGAHFSPNGKSVVFTHSTGSMSDVYAYDLSSKKKRKLIKGKGLDVSPRFSPDGNFLAFVSGRFVNPHIFLADLTWKGEEEFYVTGDKRLTFAGWYNASPAFSPDGKKIAFAGYDRDINRFDLFMMNADGKKLDRLTLKRGDNEYPSFSPNGFMLSFNSNRLGETNAKGRYKLYIMSRDGSGQMPVLTNFYQIKQPFWSNQLQ